MQDKIPYNLIAKYLSGEANAGDLAALTSWREESARNENAFQKYREVWTVSSGASAILPDKETVWERLTVNMREIRSQLYSRSFMLRISSVAAAVALLIGFSLSYLIPSHENTQLNEMIVRTPGGQKSEVVLPDGTSVWLNSGSTLAYNSGYGRVNREVSLEGEAFFDVVFDEAMKFEVRAGDIRVQVHGTAFGVKSYKEETSVDVSLLRGRVTLHSNSPNRLLADLSHGKKAVVDRNTLACTIENCNTEVENIWRYGKLRIENESISEIAAKMSRWYGVNISLQGNLKSEHYWFTVKTESLTEMLNLINKITPINYSINGEEVTIRYK
jgi:ferric-dicitrate binding protein FerR (iron transport regulator)